MDSGTDRAALRVVDLPGNGKAVYLDGDLYLHEETLNGMAIALVETFRLALGVMLALLVVAVAALVALVIVVLSS